MVWIPWRSLPAVIKAARRLSSLASLKMFVHDSGAIGGDAGRSVIRPSHSMSRYMAGSGACG
jgi:hypothetical protein